MQGRFKRDGSAAADPELRSGTDRGSAPQPAQATSGMPGDQGSDRAGRTTAVGASAGERADRKKPKAVPGGPGPRVALRNWRISTRLVSVLALPVIAATSLGALRIDSSMDNLEQLDNMKLLTDMTKQATELASALQEERDHSAGPLASGDAKNDDVVYPREKTDHAKQAFRQATQAIDASESADLVGVNTSLVNILTQLEKIKTIRANAYANSNYVALTVYQYSELISSLLALSQDMAQATSNSDMIRSTRALAAFSSAKEYASVQRAVISAGLAHEPKPMLAFSDRIYGQSAQVGEDSSLSQFIQLYAGESNSDELLQALEDGGNSEIMLADKYAARVLASDGEISREDRSYKDWYDQDSTKIDEMSHIEQTLLAEMEEKARQLRSEAEQEAIINGALILLVLGVSLAGAFVVGRAMVRSLRRLQDTAQEVSQKRLPELVKQLSESDPQDVDTSVESIGVHSRDEIGQVAAAFDDVHREAVRLASEQALLRGNVNAMFTNLSRRSQGLIQRQLTLISDLESREADPDQLSNLFKLDHLATRMRRNGENLLVLAGEEPGRRWTRPVPLVDVLRAAASEVEQYERIELNAVPSTEVAGRVVNDLVHLLAELLENATSFSSPQTKVKVTGHALPDGRVLVEIHDTGIGLSPEDLAAINERLASPPTVDVSVSRRMGLFVVGRLSLRHGIRIQLRPSDSGGTTALVMLPVDVAQGGKQAPAKPGSPGAGPGGGNAQRTPSSRLAGMQPRGQVPGGPRAALPARDNGPSGDAPGGPTAPGGGFGRPGRAGGQPPSRPGAGVSAPASAGAPFAGAFGAEGRTGLRNSPPVGAPPGRDGVGDPSRHPDLPPRGAGSAIAPPAGAPVSSGPGLGVPSGDHGRRPQLPLRGPAAELPSGSTTTAADQSQLPGTGWDARRASTDDWPTGPRDAPDAPRGHEETETTGQFQRADVAPQPTGAYPPSFQGRHQIQDPGDTAEFARVDVSGPPPGARDTGPFAVPRSPAAPEELPPASGPGDGRTPLFEALESDWFRGPQGGNGGQQAATPPAPAAAPRSPAPVPSAPRREQARGEDPGATGANWRTSPNDERARRAEQSRQPSAGGVTTSGLPRRVPRANLVAGTAQQQSHPTGPQVSRAPDAVRGRLTNLRRGIQQGREAGTDGNGFGPTYQQER